jgi:sugar O-acyltransferase (sialic acid O-acetyltransferase NeuD family)
VKTQAMSEKIVIFGAGGHAKVVVDAIEREGFYRIKLLVDSNPAMVGTSINRYRVLSEQEGLSARADGTFWAFVAIGDNQTRKRIAQIVKQRGFSLATVVHPGAVKATEVELGEGSLLMPGSVINACAEVGSNVIVNTGAIIEHDCRVGNNTHIAPRATLCGGVHIADDTLIGAGAVVLPGLKIGARVVVAAGAVVITDVPDDAIVKGIPAR